MLTFASLKNVGLIYSRVGSEAAGKNIPGAGTTTTLCGSAALLKIYRAYL
jgi:hypothetical protein